MLVFNDKIHIARCRFKVQGHKALSNDKMAGTGKSVLLPASLPAARHTYRLLPARTGNTSVCTDRPGA